MSADKQVLESLALLYLTFGHSTDGILSGEEMRALADKLRAWAPDAALGDIGELLKTTVATYKGAEDKLLTARGATEALQGKLEPDQLRTILADLEAIAAADGHVSAEEKQFIADTTRSFGL
ncbi:TerB family tellurite resistance protein [Pseudenhygromyxa sp. WMMC2535]|uniref:tellurite resistance TerB family protein n=1 Tax=Pseudenhygromyxa sp. WMMC2535 TaxID=2712867 RepID=UPI0015547634|nr:TerB family tellurite resistance protein [Pseudenhygromyxa sp. WMMC2535]NVB37199.1 TerB family tellurite resistance protein [Pseudenhygromyxa sp. WMMC2535]NVB43560.1 TerB family tellurite resistance protein [Pseudenhygromyxa sp. WMMC2535]